MRLPLSIPLVVRNVRVAGPKGSVNVDMILDTGAALTALSWADLKVNWIRPCNCSRPSRDYYGKRCYRGPKANNQSYNLGRYGSQ